MTGQNKTPRPGVGRETESEEFAAFMEKVGRKYPHLHAREEGDADNRYLSRPSERKPKKSG